ncbi:hypothetical protein OIDMADRAFT_53210 [Oidiodendron maius Zn]|uniref:Uncharacterized protein n=1 Tax=Oidiodendron maius (strain Zn) TaxID=913774 RepID=A0A0C3CRQ8_OIDMZ|nr:hypothetical protein OIDMADRAFT_53210 [Oidiodendron maius Zn]
MDRGLDISIPSSRQTAQTSRGEAAEKAGLVGYGLRNSSSAQEIVVLDSAHKDGRESGQGGHGMAVWRWTEEGDRGVEVEGFVQWDPARGSEPSHRYMDDSEEQAAPLAHGMSVKGQGPVVSRVACLPAPPTWRRPLLCLLSARPSSTLMAESGSAAIARCPLVESCRARGVSVTQRARA